MIRQWKLIKFKLPISVASSYPVSGVGNRQLKSAIEIGNLPVRWRGSRRVDGVERVDRWRLAQGNVLLPENIIDGDYTMRAGRATVVDDGGITLHPHPSAIARQKSIIFRRDLTFKQNWKEEMTLLVCLRPCGSCDKHSPALSGCPAVRLSGCPATRLSVASYQPFQGGVLKARDIVNVDRPVSSRYRRSEHDSVNSGQRCRTVLPDRVKRRWHG